MKLTAILAMLLFSAVASAEVTVKVAPVVARCHEMRECQPQYAAAITLAPGDTTTIAVQYVIIGVDAAGLKYFSTGAVVPVFLFENGAWIRRAFAQVSFAGHAITATVWNVTLLTDGGSFVGGGDIE